VKSQSPTPKPDLRKTFILDTNVFLSDVDAIGSFGDNDVVIPLAVLEELDSNKKRMDEVGRNARSACRKLDALREVGSLHDWVPLPNGGRICVMQNKTDAKSILPSELHSDKNDNLIIACALQLKLAGEVGAIVVSKDINVRVKCDALGIIAQDYLKQRAADLAENLYTGVLVSQLDDDLIATLYACKQLELEDVPHDTHPNQIIVSPRADESGTTTVIRRIGDRYRIVKDHHDVFGLEPRNKEQNFALDLLLDENVKLVTLVGPAGCGKTLIALAAGLQQTLGVRPTYDKLVVTRPIEPLGRDIGFLPGTFEEKMAPWIAPIRDNLGFLLSHKGKNGKKGGVVKDVEGDPYINLLFEQKKIEIEAVAYIRGRSIPNSFIIIDEAQNLSVHQLKTIITRSGENTKIVLCGDVHQIDVTHMDAVSNGLSYVVQAFKDEEMAGHVTLLKGERSALATRAAELL
jgi:PhoH-like ATPase